MRNLDGAAVQRIGGRAGSRTGSDRRFRRRPTRPAARTSSSRPSAPPGPGTPSRPRAARPLAPPAPSMHAVHVRTVRVCTGVHRWEKYFNRLAGTCAAPKDPPFGDGYTPFNYTSRDGDCQTGGLLGRNRSFRPPRRQFGRKYRKYGKLPVLADPSRGLRALQ